MINLKTIYGLNSFIESSDTLLNLDLQVSVDSRSINDENIFISIKGEKFNPMEHLSSIFKTGCRFVVYESSSLNNDLAQKYMKRLVFIKVNNIEKFIQEAGKAVANTFKGRKGKIIGISGSNGKTTTKDMLSHLLMNTLSPKEIISTQKNNNNHLGVPFTLFQITKKTKYAIIELGSNHPGESEVLSKILYPQYSVVTNIGDTHLEFFENKKNVFIEESVIQGYTTKLFFINADDKFLCKILSTPETKTYGVFGKDFKFEVLEKRFLINSLEVKNSFITGKHNHFNLATSLMLASEVSGIGLEKFIAAAESFMPTKNRSEWIEHRGQNIFLDAYNANPTSMMASIEGFAGYVDSNKGDRLRSCLILGDMNELGEKSPKYHEALGERLNSFGFGKVIFLGDFSKDFQRKYELSSIAFPDVKALAKSNKRHTAGFDFILIKGSRSLQLEAILDIK